MGRPKSYPTGKPYVLEGELRSRVGAWRELDRAATRDEAICLFDRAIRDYPDCGHFRMSHLGETLFDMPRGTTW